MALAAAHGGECFFHPRQKCFPYRTVRCWDAPELTNTLPAARRSRA